MSQTAAAKHPITLDFMPMSVYLTATFRDPFV